MDKPNKTSFRLDIQGLRAIAVLCVVIFHISPEHLPGGFIGVDLFFVISGYLIIGHLWRDLNNNKFNLLVFYSKRVVRLFPAYIALMIFCFIGAYFLLLPSEFTNYIYSAITSIFYVSNIWFFSQSGYFDNALQLSPLLHTWSLSVEEQFYIIFPLLFMWLYYKPKVVIFIVLGLISVISLWFSETQLSHNPSMSFFLSPFRFWQFIVGGLLSIVYLKIPEKFIANSAGFLGLGAIAYCLFFYNKHTVFPGVNAITPTLAAALLIFSGMNSTTVIYRLLSWPIATFFGNISYSLYLWHWPVIIFYKYSIDYTITRYHIVIVFIISVALGYLSYKYVELPTKNFNKKIKPLPLVVGSLCIGALLCVLMFLSIELHNKNTPLRKKEFASYLSYKPGESQRLGTCFITGRHNNTSYFDKNECIEFDPNKINTLLIGDSHAGHWYSAMRKSLKENETLSQITITGCKPTIAYQGRKVCTDIIQWSYETLIKEKKFDKIIISARWVLRDLESLKETINLIQKYTDKVVVLGPIIEYEQDLPRLLAVYDENVISNYAFYNKIKTYDLAFKNGLQGIPTQYISILDLICENQKSCISVVDGKVPLQFDYGHLTPQGAALLLDKINKLI